MKLASLSWKQAEEYFKDNDIIMIPVGSVENHGTQGPLGTDFIIPSHLAEMIEEKTEILVAPTMPYGVCPHHKSYPGTINIGYEGLVNVMRGITSSLFNQGIKRFVFLNGHGGNNAALDTVGLEIYHEGGIVACIDWWSLAGQINPEWKGGHAGGQETSAILAIDDKLVDLDVCLPRESNNLTDDLMVSSINMVRFKDADVRIMRDVRDVVESGWFGPDDPKDATAEVGRIMLDTTANYIADFIKEFKKVKLDD